MVDFLLNGKVCGIGENESLIRFLRDKEDLISVIMDVEKELVELVWS